MAREHSGGPCGDTMPVRPTARRAILFGLQNGLEESPEFWADANGKACDERSQQAASGIRAKHAAQLASELASDFRRVFGIFERRNAGGIASAPAWPRNRA